ncbi:hypothetical protein ACLUXD_05830 [Loigolactobacillus coryniformis subsp. coryniformis]|jgi:gas vesicle protein|uniref:hypothetical protein n=1 Tax=Loigolactobacillus coryniformis TaxID=1610 RepID=UPI0002F33724|nr:hypothetical protein [Loigolactobacillus coryniformis]
MKTGQKLLLGIGVTAAVAAAGAYLAADALLDKLQSYKNRNRVKFYVKDNLNGNQHVLDFVDRLNDDDIDHLLQMADKLGDVRDRVSDYSERFQDKASDWRELLSDYMKKKQSDE